MPGSGGAGLTSILLERRTSGRTSRGQGAVRVDPRGAPEARLALQDEHPLAVTRAHSAAAVNPPRPEPITIVS